MGGDKMKEAAGEANMTVITIVLIGLVAAAGAILIPQLLGGAQQQSKCSNAGGIWYDNKCYSWVTTAANGQKTCIGTVSMPK